MVILLIEYYWLNSGNFLAKLVDDSIIRRFNDKIKPKSFQKDNNENFGLTFTKQTIHLEQINSKTSFMKTSTTHKLVEIIKSDSVLTTKDYRTIDKTDNSKSTQVFEVTNSKSLSFETSRQTKIENSSLILNRNFKSSTLFCFILTTAENLKSKTKLIRNTWARLCDNHRFITILPKGLAKNSTEIVYDRLNILQPPGLKEDKYSLLTDKVYLSIKYIYEKYNNYDWYLKADDDTFIFINNLRNFLANKNSSMPVTYGYDFKVIVENGYHSGGAGYVLSRESLLRLGKKLNQNYKFCPNTGTEDVDIAQCLRLLKVYPYKSIDNAQRERFHPMDLAYHFEGYFPDWLYSYSSNQVKNVRLIFKLFV